VQVFFFFKNFAGLRAGPRRLRASPCGPQAYAGQARAGLRAHYPGPPRIFSAGLRLEIYVTHDWLFEFPKSMIING